MKTSLSTLVLMLALIGTVSVALPSEASAQRYGHFGHGRAFYGPSFYGHGYYGYGYGGYYPYGYAVAPRSNLGRVRIEVSPKYVRDAAQVYVNGGYVGDVDDFDGFFQRLYLEPGEYTIEVRLEGYRPYAETVFVSSGRTTKIKHELERLTAAELEALKEQSMMNDHSMGDDSMRGEKARKKAKGRTYGS